MRTGSDWNLFWKSRSWCKRRPSIYSITFHLFFFFSPISLRHQYFNSNHSCSQILVEPGLGPGWMLQFLSQQHLVRVWQQQDAAERRTGGWGQSFHYVRREKAGSFLPTAGLCCWFYVASVKRIREKKESRKRSCVVVRKKNIGGEEKKGENGHRCHFYGSERPDKPRTILSSSSATGYLATPSCCLQVAASRQQGCCCCWPPTVTAIYCATVSRAETWPTSSG